MEYAITDAQLAVRDRARRFAKEQLDPVAASIDRQQHTSAEVIEAVTAAGWLGAALPADWGGGGVDQVSYGLATEEIGRACSSVRSLMTVHNMAAQAILRFGTAGQQARWLPSLCSGEKRIAFALTEPNAGSAANDIRAVAEETADGLLLTGAKTWITYGMIADLFLVFAQRNDGPAAFIVERGMAGVALEPITDALGVRGSMLAHLQLDRVRIPMSHQIGATGAGIGFVANTALDHGRFSVAWGSTGIIRACLIACGEYSTERVQGGQRLIDYQLIRRRLTDILVSDTTSRALCLRSAHFRDARHPRASAETALAKYHASNAAVRVAESAVKLHGGNGCSPDFPLSRFLRDATVMSIIEGTEEMHQISLAAHALWKARAEY